MLKLQITNEDNNKIFQNLNDDQKAAVQHINGPLLIVAGAGSGKTKVITSRIAYLLSIGKSPDEILALTFTNKAAQEMKERIASLVEPEKATKIWAGTFHSIFARILRKESHLINYTPNFSIYDQEDSLSAIKSVMSNIGINIQQVNPNFVQSRISSAKNRFIDIYQFERSAESPSEKIIAKIYIEYDAYLKKNNAMDFDDLLVNMIKLLDNNKDCLNYYQNKFKYILVDEYQDTNRAQYLIIKLLAKSHQNICVVGDDAQSIYRWRGADIHNILDFQKDYPYSKIIKLEQNYRSTKTILNAADSIIKNNRNQLAKKIWTNNPDGDKIELYSTFSDYEEANKAAEYILKEKNNGRKYGDIAVFYRTNAQSLLFENALRSNQIPYLIIGSLSFYKRKEIKDVLSYFRLIINPNDNEAFLRVINEPPRGIGLTSLRNIKQYALDNNLSFLESCKYAININDLQKKAQVSALEFYNLINEYKYLVEKQSSFTQLYEFITKTGYINLLKELQTDESYDRIQNIEQLLTDIQRFYENNENSNLSDYLQQISLTSDIDNKDLSNDRVSLMTIHSAKGLEFPVVIITGLEQGLFPLERADMHYEEKEEERRLFYVAITRAKEKIYLTYSETRSRFGVVQNQSKSQFINEIPKELINSNFESLHKDNINKTKTYKKSFDNYNEYSQISNYPENYSQLLGQSELKIGDIVSHQQFGKGKIIQLSGFGQQQKADVEFESVGKKSLYLKFAKLQKI